jgi:hypothetical protein
MDTLTRRKEGQTMTTVQRLLQRIGRGFVFGFSAAIGAWIALVLLAIIVTLILRPWG